VPSSCDAASLRALKLASLRVFCDAGVLPDGGEVVPLLLVGSVAQHHTISGEAVSQLRRMPHIDWESRSLVTRLLLLYTGTLHAANLPADLRRSALSEQHRIELLRWLGRSRRAANSFPGTLVIVSAAVTSPDSSTRLRLAGLAFLRWVLQEAEHAPLAEHAPALLASLLRMLAAASAATTPASTRVSLVSALFQALGLLARRQPQVFRGRLPVLQLLFATLESEHREESAAARSALATVAAAVGASCCSPALDALLWRAAHSNASNARLCAADFVLHALPFAHVPARAISLLLVSDQNTAVRAAAQRGLRPYQVSDPTVAAAAAPQSSRSDGAEVAKQKADHGDESDAALHSMDTSAEPSEQEDGEQAQDDAVRVSDSSASSAEKDTPAHPSFEHLVAYLYAVGVRELSSSTSATTSSPGTSPTGRLLACDGPHAACYAGVLAFLEQSLLDNAERAHQPVQALVRNLKEGVLARYRWLLHRPLRERSSSVGELRSTALSSLFNLISCVPEQLAGWYIAGPAHTERPLAAHGVTTTSASASISTSTSTSTSTFTIPTLPSLELFEPARAPFILTLLFSSRAATRLAAARLLGLLAAYLPSSILGALLEQLAAEMEQGHTYLQGKNVHERHHGAILGAGHLLASCAADAFAPLRLTCLTHMVRSLTADSHVDLRAASALALSVVGVRAPLPASLAGQALTALLAQLGSKHGSLHSSSQESSSSSGNDALVEQVAGALALLCLGDPHNGELRSRVLAGLCEQTARCKREQVHFSVGEALSVVGAGWQSTAARDPMRSAWQGRAERRNETEPEPEIQIETEPEAPSGERQTATETPMDTVLRTVTERYAFSDRADERLAAGIWLLSVVKHSGAHPAVRAHASALQEVFARSLGDPSDVLQEVASRGMVLLFESGDAAQRASLVEQLVDALSSGTRTFKVTGDSEVMDERAASAAAASTSRVKDSSSPSASSTGKSNAPSQTYRELMSVALDIGRPEMAFHFLHMRSQHALWNSRRGAAFATNALLNAAREQLEPQLDQLVPRLYRLCYDPNPLVASSMENILASLASTRKEAMRQYLHSILQHLVEGCLDGHWRVREASLNALADTLIGRTSDEVEDFLAELWTRVFKLLDDRKQSVCKAALGACKALSSLTVRLCDPTHTSAAVSSRILANALPLFIQYGLQSGAEEVKQFASAQLLAVVKACGELLSEHLCSLVPPLLDGLAELEPQQLTYLTFHAERLGVDRRQLDEGRVAASRASPLAKTLDLCVRHVNDENCRPLAKALANTLTRGVGLQTRVGAARFVEMIAAEHATVARTISPLLVRTLSSICLQERRMVSIRGAYASATAALCVHCSEKPLLQLVDRIYNAYTNEDAESCDEHTAEVVALFLQRLASRISGQLAADPFAPRVISLAALGCEDPCERARKAFKAFWAECANRSSISLHAGPIFRTLHTALSSPSWDRKRQAAVAMQKLVKQLDVNTLSVPSAAERTHGSSERARFHAEYAQTFESLVAQLRVTRLWQGKGELLEALASLCVDAKLFWAEDGSSALQLPTIGSLLVVLGEECSRKQLEYRRHAVRALFRLQSAFPTVEFASRSDLLRLMLAEATKELKTVKKVEAREKVDDDDGDLVKQARQSVLQADAWRAVGVLFRASDDLFMEIQGHLAAQLMLTSWNVRVAMLESWTSLLEKISLSSLLAPTVIDVLAGRLAHVLRYTKYSAVRAACGKLIFQLMDMLEAAQSTSNEGGASVSASVSASAWEHLSVLAVECKQHSVLAPLALRITQLVDKQ